MFLFLVLGFICFLLLLLLLVLGGGGGGGGGCVLGCYSSCT